MTVSVKVEQGTITGLTIENAEDDQTYLDRAKSGIFLEIMKKQSTEEIDTVSGATYSSKGLIEATQNALKEAAGDESAAAFSSSIGFPDGIKNGVAEYASKNFVSSPFNFVKISFFQSSLACT